MADPGDRRKPSFSGGEMRLLLRRARVATLSTLAADDGGPYGSLCNIGTDVQGMPLIFVSKLALHTQNLMRDGRASVMVNELPPSGDALTGQRVTVMGRFEVADEPSLKRRYLARHPAASFYSSFADFSLWRMQAEKAHGVAGFGRIETLAAAEVFPAAEEIAGVEESALEHMNADHADAITLYAQKLLGLSGEGWQMQAIDTDGAIVVRDQESAFLAFEQPVADADSLRQAFAALSARARAA